MLSVVSLLTLNIDTPNLLILNFNEIHIWKTLTILNVSSPRDQPTGLDPDPSGVDTRRK